MTVWKHTLKGLDETESLGQALASHLKIGDLVLLEGGLGAGKTTLVRFLCRSLGVPESIAVTSPTFALMHELPGRVPIVHADLYRLSDPDELVHLGLEELMPQSVVLIEWGERFGADLGVPDLRIALTLEGEDDRGVEVTALSERGKELVGRLS